MGGKKLSPFSSVRIEFPVVHGVFAIHSISEQNEGEGTHAGEDGTWRNLPDVQALSGRRQMRKR